MDRPRLLYATEEGKIFDHPELEMVGGSAGELHTLRESELIPLPPGSELFLLPNRLPIGFNRRTHTFEILEADPLTPSKRVHAVAAFMAPAHTQTLSAAYHRMPAAPVLPLFSYTAAGWYREGFSVAGFRVDPLKRQDMDQFDKAKVRRMARQALKRHPENRLVKHLATCALTYGCPAAKNLFLKRWEAPLPTSPRCNAKCLGCISLQQKSPICASQDRLTFVPTPQEIADVAVPHLTYADAPVVSFGQGCEGEPLLHGRVLEKAMRLIRRETLRGTINLNTNGSKPQVVESLCHAGLNSIRVSLNSCRDRYYTRYFRPRGYGLPHVVETLEAVKAAGGYSSINLLCLPGVTDEEEEVEALLDLIGETKVDLIQMRNLSIDPEWYLEGIGYKPSGKKMTIPGMMKRVQQTYPHISFGYFNPYLG